MSMRRYRLFTIWLPLLGLGSLSSTGAGCRVPAACGAVPAAQAAERAPNPADGPQGDITLAQALTWALRDNPSLAEAAWQARAQGAAALRVGWPANPTLEMEVEELRLEGEPWDEDGVAWTVRVAQPLASPGALLLRGRVARLERDLASWDQEQQRADVITAIRLAWIGVLAGQEQVAATLDLVRIAREVRDNIQAQVAVGKVSPVELTRVQVELSLAELELESARGELEVARLALAESWGAQRVEFQRALGSLEADLSPPPLEDLLGLVEHNPDVARWTSELARRGVQRSLARREAIPAPTLYAGLQRLGGSPERAAVVGIALPLPVFDTHRGAIREARYQQAGAQVSQRAARTRVVVALRSTHRRLLSVCAQVTTLEGQVLPGAQGALQAMTEAYELGKAPLMDVLDAQRTVSWITLRAIAARAACHRALAELERLIGQQLPSSTPTLTPSPDSAGETP